MLITVEPSSAPVLFLKILPFSSVEAYIRKKIWCLSLDAVTCALSFLIVDKPFNQSHSLSPHLCKDYSS